jgi:hypothetical protein
MKGIEQAVAVQTKVEVHGSCSDQFAPVREAFVHNLETCQDIGASVAVFIDGEAVVDLWRGHFDGSYAATGALLRCGSQASPAVTTGSRKATWSARSYAA